MGVDLPEIQVRPRTWARRRRPSSSGTLSGAAKLFHQKLASLLRGPIPRSTEPLGEQPSRFDEVGLGQRRDAVLAAHQPCRVPDDTEGNRAVELRLPPLGSGGPRRAPSGSSLPRGSRLPSL